MVLCEIVAALGAVDVGDLDAAEAAAADRSHLELALWAEMEAGGDLCAAVGTALLDWLTQEKIDDGTDAPGHENNDEHPDAGRHVAAPNVSADVTDQKHIAGEGCTPGVAHEEAHGKHLVLVVGHDSVEEILHTDKDENR